MGVRIWISIGAILVLAGCTLTMPAQTVRQVREYPPEESPQFPVPRSSSPRAHVSIPYQVKATDPSVPDESPALIKPSPEEIREKVAQELIELEQEQKPFAHYDIPITINQQVEYYIDYFQNKMRKRFSFWLSRSSRYVPLMQKILKENGLPQDLVYLALIESGFNVQAYSRAHAVGPWQFIRETGKRYGLAVNTWIDERKDPYKATVAAARYLSDLFKEFGSWYLAAAAYNAGENKIRKALAMYDAKNFWEISGENCNYLKDETKNYVPKMIAAALIAKEPAKYGFSEIPYLSPLKFEEVEVPPGIELKQVASLCRIDLDDLLELNPILRRWCTPPGKTSFLLKVPEGKRQEVLAKMDHFHPPKRVVLVKTHVVVKKDSLKSVARTYGIPLKKLARANQLKTTARLKPGTTLKVPVVVKPGIADLEKESDPPVYLVHKKTPKEERRITYQVQKGDTLYSIGRRYGVSHKDLLAWNDLSLKDKLKVGSKLAVHMPGAKRPETLQEENSRPKTRKSIRQTKKPAKEKIRKVTYRVKGGDTLWNISNRYGVTPENIKTWNRLPSYKIKVGDTLIIKVPAAQEL